MATTRLIPMHAIKGQSNATTVHQRVDYAANPIKTENGELILSYGCDSKTAASEMLICKKEYATYIGHTEEKKSDVILYQIRQSFKPGEITPELAQKIGYELAMRFTKGKYQFIVATHTDHAHIHNHIIFNSVSMDHTQKFRNFYKSSDAIRNISDLLCLENGLSIVDHPKDAQTHYGKWLGTNRKISWQEKLRDSIDTVIAKHPYDFEALLGQLESMSYEIRKGNILFFKAPGQKRFTSLDALGVGYSEAELRAVISGMAIHLPKAVQKYNRNTTKLNLILDLQSRLQQTKGPAYERWAKVFNLKQMAQTINFLTEHSITDFEALTHLSKVATENHNEISASIKTIELKIKNLNELKKHLFNYSKTIKVYTDYRNSDFSIDFYNQNSADLLLHKAAKDAFSAFEGGKLPSIKMINEEIKQLYYEKAKLYEVLKKAKVTLRECQIAKGNVALLLGKHNGAKDLQKNNDSHHRG